MPAPETEPRAAFTLTVARAEPPRAVWDRLWDLDRHTAAIPLTRVRGCDGRPLAAGSEFVAVTRLGPARLIDAMRVETWQEPRRALIRKVGRPLRGTITVHVAPAGHGSVLTWHQTYGVRHVPDVVARAFRPLVALGYRMALQRILAPSR